MSDKLERVIHNALIAGYKPKPIPMRTESIENIIRKALFEQSMPNPATSGPMAHLSAPATGPKPDIFSKKAMGKAPNDPQDYSDVYGTYSPALSTQQRSLDINFDQLDAFAQAGQPKNFGAMTNFFSQIYKQWENQESRYRLLELGARPFLGTEAQGSGNTTWSSVDPDQLRDFVIRAKDDPKFEAEVESYFPGKMYESFQVPMYGGGMSQVGTFIYFYEGDSPSTNLVYLSRAALDTNKAFYWEYEPKKESKNAKGERIVTGGIIWLSEKPGAKEAFIEQRKDGSNTIIPAKNAVGASKIPTWVSSTPWIDKFRNSHVYLASAFKSIDAAKGEEPMIWFDAAGNPWNLTALADIIHTAFDWIGILVPPIDIINALWYAVQGRYFEAIISIIALIPGVGDAFAIAFKKIFKTVTSPVKAFYLALKDITGVGGRAAGRTAQQVLSRFNSFARQFIDVSKNIGIIPPDVAARFTAELDNILIEVIKQIDDEIAKQAQRKLRNKFNEKLGLAGGDAAEEAVETSFKGLRAAGFTTAGALWQLLTKGLAKAGKAALGILEKKSVAYWKAAYIQAYKKFMNGVLKDPDSLAMTIIGFMSKETRAKFINELFDLYVKVMNPRTVNTRNGQIIYQFTDNAGTWTANKTQLISKMMENPGPYLRKIFSTAQNLYEDFAVTVVRAAVTSEGKIVNAFWHSFWTNPWRRWVSENLTLGRVRSLVTPEGKGWRKNATDELKASFKDLLTQDVIKKLDIIYNEIQAYLEQHDFGADVGGEMSRNSIIYTIVDEAWWAFTGEHLIDTFRAVDDAIDKRLIDYDRMESSNQSNPTGMVGDSLTYQFFINDTPGQANYKTTWMNTLVKRNVAKYIGQPTKYTLDGKSLKLPGYPTWAIIKNDSDNGVKKGHVYVINPNNGVMSNSDPDGQLSFEGEFPGYVKFAKIIAANPELVAGMETTGGTLSSTKPLGVNAYKKKNGDWDYAKIINSRNFVDIGNLIYQSRGGMFGNDQEAIAEAAFLAMAKAGMPSRIYSSVATVIGYDPYKYVSNEWDGFMNTSKSYYKTNGPSIDSIYQILRKRENLPDLVPKPKSTVNRKLDIGKI